MARGADQNLVDNHGVSAADFAAGFPQSDESAQRIIQLLNPQPEITETISPSQTFVALVAAGQEAAMQDVAGLSA